MKRKSTVITVSALAILAIMVALLVIEDKGFGLRVLLYVIPYFTLSFGTYGILLGLSKNHIWLQEKRVKMLNKGKGLKMVVNVLPTFAAIYGAMTISNMSDVQCVMTGLIIGAAWGVAAFFFDIGSAFTMKYEKIEDVSKHKAIYRIRENVPVEKSTQGDLTTWMVYHFGPFNFAYYYGEC